MMRIDDRDPAVLPFAGADEPDTRVREVFVIHGEPHQLTVCVWADDRYSAELVSLVSGTACPLSEDAPRASDDPAPARPSATRRV